MHSLTEKLWCVVLWDQKSQYCKPKGQVRQFYESPSLKKALSFSQPMNLVAPSLFSALMMAIFVTISKINATCILTVCYMYF